MRCWALVLLMAACQPRGDSRGDQHEARMKWVHAQAAEHDWYVRDVLNGSGDIDFYDGWYPPENDPKTGGGWRWMDKRGITELRTHVAPNNTVADMTLTIYGWVPWQDVGLRTNTLELAVNGHVLETFDPPHESFVHTVFVPRSLLEKSDWVDFVITAANTARPRGDWRDLGFCTTGFVWKPAT
jgi:hypothetical protein